MEIRVCDADHVVLYVSLDDLGTMGNSLNEVCHGIRVTDFESKMGTDKDKVKQALDDIVPIYRKFDKLKASHVVVRFMRWELRAIIGALQEVCREFDESEFHARMGAERHEVDAILYAIIPIYHQMGIVGK